MESLAALDLDPKPTPSSTPSGGFHDYFIGPDVKNIAATDNYHPLGRGIDIRSKAGYVVGEGSTVGGQNYHRPSDDAGAGRPVPAPASLLSLCAGPRDVQQPGTVVQATDQDTPAAVAAAIDYLEARAPLAVEGRGGDHCTYTVACFLRDFEIAETTALGLLAEYWN